MKNYFSILGESKVDSTDSSKLFLTYPNVTSNICPGFYANVKLSDDPRKGESFVAKFDDDDYNCIINMNTVTCFIDHLMYDGEEFDGISIVSATNSSKIIAQKEGFVMHYVGMYKILKFFCLFQNLWIRTVSWNMYIIL